ncbi:hypothetical protein B6U90_01795 [Thermoplasmatales archaeon ex4484_6]|nr:MAG: hypothetical protein B6U90_01795 [Thermoplasmatales archaeon ex4484_6]
MEIGGTFGVKGLKEVNYLTLDCHSLIHEESSPGSVENIISAHTSLEIEGIRGELDLEVEKVGSVISAARTYRAVLESLLEEEGVGIRIEKYGSDRMNLTVSDCDFGGACPKARGCFCLRGEYIGHAVSELSGCKLSSVKPVYFDDGVCHLTIHIEPAPDKEWKTSSTSIDHLPADLEASLRSLPAWRKRKFQMRHYTRGTLKAARDVLPRREFETFIRMFNIQLKEAVRNSTPVQKRGGDVLIKGISAANQSGGGNGSIISCPKCGSFINLDKGRSCFRCGYRF